MLEPVAVRPTYRITSALLPVAAATAAGLMLAAAVELARAQMEPIVQATRSLALKGELVGLRTDPYRGPEVVLACLAQGSFCYEEWVPYAAIDAVADLGAIDPFGACVPGCLFIRHPGADWTCERHVFYFPLAAGW